MEKKKEVNPCKNCAFNKDDKPCPECYATCKTCPGNCNPTIESIAVEGPSIKPKADNVNHPSHYETGKFECIEVMQEVFGIMAVCDFCKCNAFKYIYRMDRKNGDEDARKAIWYLNKYLELSEKIDIYKEVGGLIPRPEFVKDDGGTDDGRKEQVPEGE